MVDDTHDDDDDIDGFLLGSSYIPHGDINTSFSTGPAENFEAINYHLILGTQDICHVSHTMSSVSTH